MIKYEIVSSAGSAVYGSVIQMIGKWHPPERIRAPPGGGGMAWGSGETEFGGEGITTSGGGGFPVQADRLLVSGVGYSELIIPKPSQTCDFSMKRAA